MLFLSTFISGLQEVARDVLTAHRVGSVHLLLDGLVVYERKAFQHIEAFNNTFEVLLMERAGGLDALLRALDKKGGRVPLRAMRSKRFQTFRIVASAENALVALDPARRAALEGWIARETGLSVNRSRPSVEFWLLARKEGPAFFLRRITNNRVDEKKLQKGELRPELCYMMNWLSRPGGEDIYVDPFCGSGALLLSRARIGACGHLLAYDIDARRVEALRRRLRAEQNPAIKRLTVEVADVRELPALLRGKKVNRIVTDPPWGLFEPCDVPALYRDMLQSFASIAQKGAVLVLLTAQKAAFEEALAAFGGGYRVTDTFDILVSGKKAAIYRVIIEGSRKL